MKGTEKGGPGCHYRRELVAVPPEQFDQAEEALGDEAEPVGAEELGGILGEDSDPDLVGQILDFVRYLKVGRDPWEVANQLRDRGIEASPVHAMGFLSHISYKPGTKPDPAPGALPDVDAGSEDRIVAVVDSGISEDGLPSWMNSSVRYDPFDVESLGNGDASHGTFVCGLIRQLTPEHTVSLVKPRTVAVTDLLRQPKRRGHRNAPDPTTELDVAYAIVRLADRLAGKEKYVKALNLSLGAYTWDPDRDPLLVTLSRTIDFWRSRFKSECGIFAAGGNIPGSTPIWPGAYETVRAVGATANGVGQVVWDASDHEVPAHQRDWIDDVAPGSRLKSLSGRGTSLVEWSGSSFASAVAAALCVRGDVPQQETGTKWWPGKPVDYDRVRGLQHAGADTAERMTGSPMSSD